MSKQNKSNDVVGTVNRGNPCESGLCTLCRADCQGRCETWLSSMKKKNTISGRFWKSYSRSANTGILEFHYNSLRIQGYNYGAVGLPPGLSNSADDCIFPNVNLETSFGGEIKTKSEYL